MKLSGLFRRIRIRVFQYEFWSWWLFFIPLIPAYIFYAIRLKNPVYFTAANPGIDLGGFFGEEKTEILDQIPDEYVVKSQLFINPSFEALIQGIQGLLIDFPLIIKPDVGERGEEVYVIQDKEHLHKYLPTVNYPFIIQEYVQFPIELGVLYSRLPKESKGRVTSVVRKKFLTVVGDGKQTIEDLLGQTNRGYLQVNRLLREKPQLMAEIPTYGKEVLVEPIGNHALGTEFINANHLINEKLNEVFDKISIPFEGFYYGRYDLRIRSIEEMYEGKGIRIFELNGVTSEPGHIYDRDMSLFKAYTELLHHQKDVFRICRQNLRIHGNTIGLSVVLKRAYQHFFLGKR